MPVLTTIDVKEEYYQNPDTITLRLRPPFDLLDRLETSVDANSVSLKLDGEEVWRAELYNPISVDNFSCRIAGKWIEISLRKEKPGQWPSLRRALLKLTKIEVPQTSSIVKMEEPTDTKPLPKAEVEMRDDTKNNSTNGLAELETKSKIPKLSEGTEEPSPSFQMVECNRSGLENVGNTCFMNCVLQCLVNCVPLRNYFIDGGFYRDLNATNPLGYNGLLAKNYHKLVEKIWIKGEKVINPLGIKQLVSKKNHTFSGYGQQDAHEFMNYLLDGLHEDLNRVIDKPLTNQVLSNGREDGLVAEEAWQIHKQRNDSFITDNFQGQFRSTLVCPECRNVSVTFDPFMTLSVPLPKKTRLFVVHMFWRDETVTPKRYKLVLPTDANLELLKAALGRKIGLHMNKLSVFEAYHSKIQKNLRGNEIKVCSIKESDVIVVHEVLSETEVRERVVEVGVLQRVSSPKMPTHCAQCQKPGGIVELKRCTNCMGVAYCGRNCQSQNWAQHQSSCRVMNDSNSIGMPFIVSLPRSKWTYRNLAMTALKYASRSVLSESNETPDQQDVDDGMLQAFTMRPVNNFGSNIVKSLPLNSDNKDSIITDEFDFLAIDWVTDPKKENFVKITEKKVDYSEDESMSAQQIEEPNVTTIHHCIEAFSEPETLSESDAWYCSVCKEHREATKMMSLWRLPSILLIQLKRFRNVLSGDKKLTKHVDYPISGLDLSKYTLGVEQDCVYDLFGVVHHRGYISGGHYISFASATPGSVDDWICYDDTITRTSPISSVVSEGAYILLYKQRADTSV